MDLYFRTNELSQLDTIFDTTVKGSNFVLLYGKRRVGKTTLVREHLKRRKGAYISISIKASALQLNDISDYLKSFNFTTQFIPGFRSWEEFFLYIFHISKDTPLNLVIDEFQNFNKIAPGFYSELKNLWDQHARGAMLNLIAVTYSEQFVDKTFRSPESPLYGITRHEMKISPFSFSEVLKIAKQHHSTMKFEEIRNLYLIFGGLPKFYELIHYLDLWNSSVEDILRELLFKKYAPLASELNSLLVADFGRGSTVYLSIMQSIAAGKNVVSEIAENVSIPVTSTTKYLSELEHTREVIKRRVPLGTLDASKSKYGRYYFRNYFDNFWFRFIQPDIISYEMSQYEKMLSHIAENLDAYIHERLPLLLKEIFREFREHPEILSITGSPDVIIDGLWTRKTSFDLALLNKETASLKMCRILTAREMAEENCCEKLMNDLAEVEGKYISYIPELILFTEVNPTRKILEKIPVNIKVFPLDHLEGLMKRKHKNGHSVSHSISVRDSISVREQRNLDRTNGKSGNREQRILVRDQEGLGKAMAGTEGAVRHHIIKVKVK